MEWSEARKHMKIEDLYKQCYLIRQFELSIEREFEKGTMRGTTHGCIGQEIVPVCLMDKIDKEQDYVTGTHRCHGQVLAYTCDLYKLACEMMGKEDGFVDGNGGSQHIKTGKYITNGITGGMVGIGVGMAMGLKKTNSQGIVVSFLGDGGFNEGYVLEAMNLSQIYSLPILFICENNQYAMSTFSATLTAGNIMKRVQSFGMQYLFGTTTDYQKIYPLISEGYEMVKKQRIPVFIELVTDRLCGHSKSDPMDYMTEEEKSRNRENDYLLSMRKQIGEETAIQIEKQIMIKIEDVFKEVRNCPTQTEIS